MYYVYLIRSLSDPNRTYAGYTLNFNERFAAHNSGKSSHTAKYTPWELIVCLAFPVKEQALSFELYLKSHSGRAFASKRFMLEQL